MSLAPVAPVEVCVCRCAVRFHRIPTFSYMSKSYQACYGSKSKMCYTLHKVVLREASTPNP